MGALLGPGGLGGEEPFAISSPLAVNPEVSINPSEATMTGTTTGATNTGGWFSQLGDLMGQAGQNIFRAAQESGIETPDSPERAQADLLNFEKFLETRTTIGGTTMKITTILLIAGAVWFLFLRK